MHNIFIVHNSDSMIFFERLKRQKILLEKDARSIFMQIMSGLRYLNKPFAYGSGSSNSSSATASGDIHIVEDEEHGDNNALMSTYNRRRLSVIHYDLKPANILFDEMGDVKITGMDTWLGAVVSIGIL